MKRAFLVILALILVSCASVKKKTSETKHIKKQDTLIVHTTDTVTKIDSTYKERYLAVLRRLNESNDSIVIVKYKDRVVTRKYGNTKELNSIKSENEKLKNKIQELSSEKTDIQQSKKHKIDQTKQEKIKKTTFWKKAALITWGLILVYLFFRFYLKKVL